MCQKSIKWPHIGLKYPSQAGLYTSLINKLNSNHHYLQIQDMTMYIFIHHHQYHNRKFELPALIIYYFVYRVGKSFSLTIILV